MVAQTVISGSHWLSPAAAASWRRMRAAGMPSGGITEAGRTRARQEYLYAQYLAGKLVAYAAVPGSPESRHETGHAIDIQTASAAQAWLIAHGAAYGWARPLLNRPKPEPWHWEYDLTRDRHLAGPITTTPPAPEEDVMASLADVQAAVAAATRPHAFRLPGTDAAYEQVGYGRRWLGPDEARAREVAITDADALEPFWALPIVGPIGGLVKRAGRDDAWLVAPVDGRTHRRWVQRDEYVAMGQPTIAVIAVSSTVWTLPTTGPVPSA